MSGSQIGLNGPLPYYGTPADVAVLNGTLPPTASYSNAVPQQQQPFQYDPRNLEIKTKSVEQTLLPLVTQITMLVNFKETIITGNKPRSERALRAAMKIGTAVEAAVERFVVVGETIADENPDIQPEMYDACQNARIAGSSIANLHGAMVDEQTGQTTVGIDKTQLVRAARQLLSSVTRVLLLADRVLVKHILRAEDKIAYSLTKLENTSNFTEFVKIFTEFGGEMVDLAHRSGDRQHDLKSERRKAQMAVARSCLERLTMLLLTSSKTLLRHPEDIAARQCRNGVFYQIRLSLQLIADCITDGVMPIEPHRYCPADAAQALDMGLQMTASNAVNQLTELLEMVRMTSMVGAGIRERLVSSLDAICELTQDFTDSSFTPHHHREQILDFLEECRFEMGNLIQPENEIDQLRNESIQVAVERLNRRLKDLQKQLQLVAMDQIAAVFRANDDHTILNSIKTCSVSGDMDGVEKYLEKFRAHAEHLQEICRLLHHISVSDALSIFTGHAERNLRALAPLTLLAGRTLCIHPSSRIARENLEVFCDTWAANVNDLSRASKDLDTAASERSAGEKQAYMSLPRPGVSLSSQSSLSSSVSLSSAPLTNCCADIGGIQNTSKCNIPLTTKKNAVNVNEAKRNEMRLCTPPQPSSSDESSSGYQSNYNGSQRPTTTSTTALTSSSTSSGPNGTPGGETSVRSAFVKYRKPKGQQSDGQQVPSSIVFHVKDPHAPVILRQDPSRQQSEPEHHKRAPLAKIEDDEEAVDDSCESPASTEKHHFEYRLSVILESLQLEAESLKSMDVFSRSHLHSRRNNALM